MPPGHSIYLAFALPNAGRASRIPDVLADCPHLPPPPSSPPIAPPSPPGCVHFGGSTCVYPDQPHTTRTRYDVVGDELRLTTTIRTNTWKSRANSLIMCATPPLHFTYLHSQPSHAANSLIMRATPLP